MLAGLRRGRRRRGLPRPALGTGPPLLDNVAVAPDRQGSGIGGFLLAYAEHRARAEHRSEIQLYTHVSMVENIARYTALGYVETHRETQSGFNRVFMTKMLDR